MIIAEQAIFYFYIIFGGFVAIKNNCCIHVFVLILLKLRLIFKRIE